MDFTEANETCRCCLNTSDHMFQMSEIVFDQFNGENECIINAVQSYFYLTGLTEDSVSDSSLKICSACKTLLETSSAFRKTCLASHQILLNRIKEEPYEEEMICEVEGFEIKPEIVEEPARKLKQAKRKVTNKKPKRKPAKQAPVPLALPLASGEKEIPIDFVTANFVCMFCDVPAKNYAHLIKHRQNHRLHSSRDCKMCGEVNCEDFEGHVALAHPEYRPQQCLRCDATFINHKELKQHLLTHMAAERYQCMACASNFGSQIGLRMHIANNCSAATQAAWRCHVCGLVVGTLAAVQQHIFDKHPKDFRKRYFPCFHCKRILVGAQSGVVCKTCQGWLKTTEKEMKGQGISPKFHCDKCQKKFYHEEAYECHQIFSHSAHSYCFECDKAFWTIAEQRAHKKSVHPVASIRRHRMCDECGKVFQCQYKLTVHLLTHQSKPQFKCTYPGCESAAYTAERLSVHVRRCHEKEYKYQCHYCGKRMNLYSYIFTHFTRAHFPHLRKYGCDVNTCTRRFASITDKKRHMVTHTGEKLVEKAPHRGQNANPGAQPMMEGVFPQYSADFQ